MDVSLSTKPKRGETPLTLQSMIRSETAVKALRGEELSKEIDTGFHWFDATNIDDPDIAALLYQ